MCIFGLISQIACTHLCNTIQRVSFESCLGMWIVAPHEKPQVDANGHASTSTQFPFNSLAISAHLRGCFPVFNLNVDSVFRNYGTTAIQLNVFCGPFAGLERKLFQDSDHCNLGFQHGKPGPDAASGTGAKRQEGVGFDLLLLLSPEPVRERPAKVSHVIYIKVYCLGYWNERDLFPS